MKSIHILTIFAFMIGGDLIAAPPSEVRLQLESDFKSFFASQGGQQVSDQQISEAVTKMANEGIKLYPAAFELTSTELIEFNSDKCPFSDKQIENEYAALKKLVNGRPMPVVIESYHKSFAAGHLTPKQKTIFYRLTSAITDLTTKQLKESEQGAAANP